MSDFGYPSREPCCICTQHKNNQSEPRFGYVVCDDHQRLNPVEVSRLVQLTDRSEQIRLAGTLTTQELESGLNEMKRKLR